MKSREEVGNASLMTSRVYATSGDEPVNSGTVPEAPTFEL
jgi:hypothetical protein